MRYLALAAVVLLAACGGPEPTPRPDCPEVPPTLVEAEAALEGAGLATVTVSGAVSGEFAFELYGEQAPHATGNFVLLARCGFYEDIKFHRVLTDFVIQAGDPKTKDHEGDFEGIGTGDPGYQFDIEPPSEDLAYTHYSVSMANNRRANGTQFFVAIADLREGLARSYTIFGQVVSGTDTVDAIAALPVNDPRIGVPTSPVVIESIVISAAPEE